MTNLIDNVTNLQIQENLNQTLDDTKISNCILEAPNGVFTTSNKNITLKAGLKVAIPNGRNADGTLNNIILTLDTDVSRDVEYGAGQNRTVFLTSNKVISNYSNSYIFGTYLLRSSFPSTVSTTNTYLAYAEDTNYWYSTNGSTTANWSTITVVPIASFYYTDTAVTTSSNNFVPKLVDTTMADGQWIGKTASLASSYVSAPTSTNVDYSLNSYLPKDGYDYEVIFYAITQSGTASGNYVFLTIVSDLGITSNISGVSTRTTSSMYSAGSLVLPIGGQRTVSVLASSSNTGSYRLYARAYRRLGTNC